MSSKKPVLDIQTFNSLRAYGIWCNNIGHLTLLLFTEIFKGNYQTVVEPYPAKPILFFKSGQNQICIAEANKNNPEMN